MNILTLYNFMNILTLYNYYENFLYYFIQFIFQHNIIGIQH